MKLGYDLGPAGADGVMGAKTKKALAAYAGIYQSQKEVNNQPIEVDADGLGDWALVTGMYKQLYRRTEPTTDEP